MNNLSHNHKPSQTPKPATDASISTLFPLATDVALLDVEMLLLKTWTEVGASPAAQVSCPQDTRSLTLLSCRSARLTLSEQTFLSSPSASEGGKERSTPLGATSSQTKPGKRLVNDTAYLSKRELNGVLVASLEEVGRFEESDRVKECFYEFVECRSICGYETRELPCKCHNRLCSFCSEERAKRMRERLQAALERCGNPKMLTVTFKSVRHISRDYVNYMLECFRKLRRRKFFKGKVKGGVYCFEFTYSLQHGYHPHIHCLIDAGFIEQREISEAWREITKDSYVVDIREANNNALEEVVKYLCKNANFVGRPNVVDEFLTATEHQRLIQTFGSFHNFDDAEAFFENEEIEDKGDFWICGCGCSVRQGDWERRETRVKAEDIWIDHRGRYVASGRYVVD